MLAFAGFERLIYLLSYLRSCCVALSRNGDKKIREMGVYGCKIIDGDLVSRMWGRTVKQNGRNVRRKGGFSC
jgi:hypothetical protein